MTLLVGGAGLPPVPANLVAIVVCSVANYWLADRVVFE
jgi:putative flippase GtrA